MEFLINELDEEEMNDFRKYKNSIEIFGSRQLKDYTNDKPTKQSTNFLVGSCFYTIHPKLSAFAIKIL